MRRDIKMRSDLRKNVIYKCKSTDLFYYFKENKQKNPHFFYFIFIIHQYSKALQYINSMLSCKKESELYASNGNDGKSAVFFLF